MPYKVQKLKNLRNIGQTLQSDQKQNLAYYIKSAFRVENFRPN